MFTENQIACSLTSIVLCLKQTNLGEIDMNLVIEIGGRSVTNVLEHGAAEKIDVHSGAHRK